MIPSTLFTIIKTAAAEINRLNYLIWTRDYAEALKIILEQQRQLRIVEEEIANLLTPVNAPTLLDLLKDSRC